MLITVMLSLQYQNNMLLATSNIECQDGKQKKITSQELDHLCFEQI